MWTLELKYSTNTPKHDQSCQHTFSSHICKPTCFFFLQISHRLEMWAPPWGFPSHMPKLFSSFTSSSCSTNLRYACNIKYNYIIIHIWYLFSLTISTHLVNQLILAALLTKNPSKIQGFKFQHKTGSAFPEGSTRCLLGAGSDRGI